MSKRPTITPKMKVDALLYRISPLCICGNFVYPGEAIDWDHVTPLALGGAHHAANLRPIHRDCHRKKTTGTGATTAGSDIGKIAKVKRIVRTEKMVVKRQPPSDALLAAAAADTPKRKWPKGRKMQSRPFQKKEKAA